MKGSYRASVRPIDFILPRQELLPYRATARGEDMADRRRSRRRALTDFANRSPIHAFAAWILRAALIAAAFVGLWLLVANWAVPSLVDGFRP